MPDNRTDIKALYPEELSAFMGELGQPRYRADQLFSWFARGCSSWDEMTDLPQRLRSELSGTVKLTAPVLIAERVSESDGTAKYLWEMDDGNLIETVVMRYRYGNTVCISSQVGCAQGCAFCASSIGGKVRDLRASEMLDEVLFSEKAFGAPISRIVIMGIGEPLDNYEEVIRFLRLISHGKGRNISCRNITISTCGLIERFDDLAAEDLPVTLSVSLHAPDDETRNLIMPSNRSRGVKVIAKKCGEYYRRTGRRVTFEYAMIRDVNDSDEQAAMLAGLAGPLHIHVNLIPLNHVEERDLKPSSPERIREFARILEEKRVNVTVRRSLGGDVDAACGQLRRRYRKEQE